MRSVVCLILLASLVEAAEIPNTLISENETEPIRSAIIRKEAWTLDAVKRLRVEAERNMKDGPWSVTDDRPVNSAIDPHEYYTEAPYWWPNPDDPGGPYIRRDGQVYQGRFVANKTALNQMADAVFTLGSAAFFLGEPRYARRAARIVRVWFIDPETRMNPNMQYAQFIPGVSNGQGAGIVEGRAFIRAIQGMEFLAESGAWNEKDQAVVHRWFDEYLRWLVKSPAGDEEKASGNYHASWWAAQTAAVATFVENEADMQMAFQYYGDHMFPRQIRADGSAPHEESRPHPMALSAINLEAFTTICRIAQVHGVNLWNVKAKNGATLSTVIGHLEPYLADPRKFLREQAFNFPNDGLYFLAFAGMGMNKPEYVALFRKLEHPDSAWVNVIDLLVARWEAAGHQTRH